MSTPEFSRLVPLARLGAEPFRQQITATEGERRRWRDASTGVARPADAASS